MDTPVMIYHKALGKYQYQVECTDFNLNNSPIEIAVFSAFPTGLFLFYIIVIPCFVSSAFILLSALR